MPGELIDLDALCRCRAAVVRAYEGMIAGGEPEPVARDAAGVVFRWYHPTFDAAESDRVVEGWIAVRLLH